MAAPVKLTPEGQEHIIREWDKLNAELDKLLGETRSREKYSITIIAGVVAWVLVDLKDNNVAQLICWIPVVTTLFFGVSVFLLYKNILWIGEYLKKIEDYFLPGNPHKFGWETYFRKANNYHFFVFLSILMWVVQFGLAIAFGFYIHGHW